MIRRGPGQVKIPNIARLLDIIRLVDVEVALDELQIIPLSYAGAAEMANILNQLFQAGRLRTTGLGGAPAPAPAVAPAAPAAPGAVGGAGGTDKPVDRVRARSTWACLSAFDDE